jgi:hypothetical protein
MIFKRDRRNRARRTADIWKIAIALVTMVLGMSCDRPASETEAGKPEPPPNAISMREVTGDIRTTLPGLTLNVRSLSSGDNTWVWIVSPPQWCGTALGVVASDKYMYLPAKRRVRRMEHRWSVPVFHTSLAPGELLAAVHNPSTDDGGGVFRSRTRKEVLRAPDDVTVGGVVSRADDWCKAGEPAVDIRDPSEGEPCETQVGNQIVSGSRRAWEPFFDTMPPAERYDRYQAHNLNHPVESCDASRCCTATR